MATSPEQIFQAIAAVKAFHFLHVGGEIHSDPLALKLLSSFWQFIVRRPWLFRRILSTRAVHGQILGCCGYTEEALELFLGDRPTQLVICNAGLNSLALRKSSIELDQLKIFEIDRSSTFSLKRQRVRQGLQMEDFPPNMHALPIADNADVREIVEVLEQSPFYASDVPSFVSFLGISYYLTPDTLFATLQGFAKRLATGSHIVLDYANRDVNQNDQKELQYIQRFNRKRGASLRTMFDGQVFENKLRELGFDILDHSRLSNWRSECYEKPSLADLKPWSFVYMIHLEVK